MDSTNQEEQLGKEDESLGIAIGDILPVVMASCKQRSVIMMEVTFFIVEWHSRSLPTRARAAALSRTTTSDLCHSLVCCFLRLF